MSGSGARLSWRQAICERCWLRRRPGRAPIRVPSRAVVLETCSYCGSDTIFGIYVRDNPALVPFPRFETGAS
jgi:hypothetical protein